ncbi:uncharacterized protein BDV17DRAFT_268016 [Aspergillus undulatus]|uniref:uncharacterized protein n=1 Tax=Aspergillus undulatus TaxID=1810928 RepID=UPI003CCD82A5
MKISRLIGAWTQSNAPGVSPLPWSQRSRATVLSAVRTHIDTRRCVSFVLANFHDASYKKMREYAAALGKCILDSAIGESRLAPKAKCHWARRPISG